ncbi:S1 family peptidase [Vibrio superstes]|uniref:Serine protease n=1 Tax=Vibrio superstes NBRC 103154 TaxID=1219062 RepID=A0A511QL41_9VIBR|nr:trypsin-like serine protease [Vibrio superstes]GEM78049.1 serine protease [Vibrio superstes NBRC 103154]
MHKAFRLAACAVVSLGPVHAVATDGGASTYIVNGISVSIQTFPSFSSLYFDQLDTSGLYQNYCGATILDEYHVLTAAHCVEGDSYYYTYTSIAPQLENEQQVLSGSVQLIRASEFYYPDTFVDNEALSWPDDIAIVKLENPMPVDPSDYVTLASMNDILDYDVVGTEMVTIGHGYTRSGTDDSDGLQGTTQRLLSRSGCSSAGTSSKQLCLIGDYSPETDLLNSTCGGDSGGPLYWYNGSQYVQVGITSYGPTQCGNPDSDYSSAYTEVAEYRGWIADVLAGREIPQVIVTEFDRENYTPDEGDSGFGDESGGSFSWAWLLALIVGRGLQSHRSRN